MIDGISAMVEIVAYIFIHRAVRVLDLLAHVSALTNEYRVRLRCGVRLASARTSRLFVHCAYLISLSTPAPATAAFYAIVAIFHPRSRAIDSARLAQLLAML
jgi:hypothetical protein